MTETPKNPESILSMDDDTMTGVMIVRCAEILSGALQEEPKKAAARFVKDTKERKKLVIQHIMSQQLFGGMKPEISTPKEINRSIYNNLEIKGALTNLTGVENRTVLSPAQMNAALTELVELNVLHNIRKKRSLPRRRPLKNAQYEKSPGRPSYYFTSPSLKVLISRSTLAVQYKVANALIFSGLLLRYVNFSLQVECYAILNDPEVIKRVASVTGSDLEGPTFLAKFTSLSLSERQDKKVKAEIDLEIAKYVKEETPKVFRKIVHDPSALLIPLISLGTG